MDILSYLSELIQTRKTVGIAGLGTIYKKKVPGRYDASAHSFVPPSYTLQFTAELKEDVLLPEYISKQRNVSAETSNYFINEFSEGILQTLESQQEVGFGDLGKLVKKDGQIVLEPSDQINYGFDFYGLPSIKGDDAAEHQDAVAQPEPELSAEEIIPELQHVEEPVTENNNAEAIADEDAIPEVEDEVIPEPEEEPTLASVSTENERLEENPGDEIKDTETAEAGISRDDEQQLRSEIEALNYYRAQSPVSKPTISEQEEVISKLNQQPSQTPVQPVVEQPAFYASATEEENKAMPLFLKIIMGLLVLVIMMAIAYYVKPEWFNSITGNQSNAVQKVQPITPVAPVVDSTVTADSVKVNDSVSQPAAVKKDTTVKTTVVTQPADTAVVYEIIGASMHDQKEADGFIAQMKKSGITAKVVTNMSGRRLKMSIATLKDEESAKLEMERLSKKLKIPGIYIYRNKQK